ncbi:hypothetical protein THF1D04_10484 [Vibrio owensii]|uniref:Uncharacterized protein n=1 Tax=Vibrio owensii TaxID=696485 RepID=A0AAU9PY31_9VIBR|nr:hypothetical protein THF1D04_10484 [Vibrio owensii]
MVLFRTSKVEPDIYAKKIPSAGRGNNKALCSSRLKTSTMKVLRER